MRLKLLTLNFLQNLHLTKHSLKVTRRGAFIMERDARLFPVFPSVASFPLFLLTGEDTHVSLSDTSLLKTHSLLCAYGHISRERRVCDAVRSAAVFTPQLTLLHHHHTCSVCVTNTFMRESE